MAGQTRSDSYFLGLAFHTIFPLEISAAILHKVDPNSMA